MLSLKDAHDCEIDYSSRASDVARNLGYAGLGLIWIFKTDQPDGSIHLPTTLLRAAGFIALALAIDFLQYFVLAFWWGKIHRREERAAKVQGGKYEEYQFQIGKSLSYAGDVFWFTKSASVIVAYVFILSFVSQKFFK